MYELLTANRLDGVQTLDITVRPDRTAVLVPTGSFGELYLAIENLCQIWGGATFPIIPVGSDRAIPPMYLNALKDSHIENIRGFAGGRACLFDEAPRSDIPSDLPEYGLQFALAMLAYEPSDKPRIRVPRLRDGDPWKPCYAAALGMLPDIPSPTILDITQIDPSVTFSNFASIDYPELSGSINNLLSHSTRPLSAWTPRMASMARLPYGITGSSSLRGGDPVIPGFLPPIYDAGPNIIVAFGDDSFADAVLLWNLRTRSGDGLAVPIGVPINCLSSAIDGLIASRSISLNGSPVRRIYVTSVSASLDSLRQIVDTNPHAGVAAPESLLSFHPGPGWRRQELTTFKDGVGSYIPIPAHSEISGILTSDGTTPYLRLTVEVSVRNHPFPDVPGNSFDIPFSMSSLAGGTSAAPVGVSTIATPSSLRWPATWNALCATANLVGLDPVPSTPGRAAISMIEGVGGLAEFANMCHTGLLGALDTLASSTGFGYYKKRLRSRDEPEPGPEAGFARTAAELSSFTADNLRETLGSNSKVKAWLAWAVRSEVVTQGFQIKCEACDGKFWLPLTGFTPPIRCPSCGTSMSRPFGDSTSIVFRYRITERLRRVYEHDAVGHILAARFFSSVLHDHVVGVHPGVEFRERSTGKVIGEADVLLLTTGGGLIPVEVKRSHSGFTNSDATKLEALTEALGSPWSAVVVCENAADIPKEFVDRVVQRNNDGSYSRMLLTLEHITLMHPVWLLGADPFAIGQTEDIQGEFLDSLPDVDSSSADRLHTVDFLDQLRSPMSFESIKRGHVNDKAGDTPTDTSDPIGSR